MSVAPTVLLGAVLSALAGAVYVGLGRRLARRSITGPALTAANAFVVWWVGVGVLTSAGAAFTLAVAADLVDLALALTFAYAFFLALYITLGALCYYLVYVHTGDARWLGWIGAFYAGLYVWTIWLITSLGPLAVAVGRWSWRIDYRHALAPGDPLTQAFLVLFMGPPIAAAIAYATLWFRVPDATSRWRIALVSGAFVVWFGGAAAASAFQASGSDTWQVASRLIGVAAALVVLLAYFPPTWARRRLGVAALGEEAA